MKKLLLISLILVLLCGCGDKEDDIQYASADKNQENLFVEMPLSVPKYTHDTNVCLLEKYRVSIYVDFAGMYYDEKNHTIGLLIDSYNGNNSDITIKADAIVNNNKDNVDKTEYEVILGKDRLVESDLKIKLNENYHESLDSIELTFDISSSSGKRLVVAPYKIENFYSSTVENPRMITPQVTGGGVLSGSDIWLDEEIDVDLYQYELLTGKDLAEVIAKRDGISKEEAKEQLEQKEIDKIAQEASEKKESELKAAGNKRIGNDVLGYLEIPEVSEEICNENERIEYRYEDEKGIYTISMYLDSMDMTEGLPYFKYSSNIGKEFTEKGGILESGVVSVKKEKDVTVIGLLYYIVDNLTSDTPLTFHASMESPLDATKVIVVKIDFNVNSDMNRNEGIKIINTYKHSYYNTIY